MLLIHEVNPQGQHRIIHVDDNKKMTEGEWVEARQLAQHMGFYANSDVGNGLPPGIFRVKEFEHQVLA